MNPQPIMSEAEAATILLDELANERLTVELFPARSPRYEGHMVRVATGCNPLWYRRLAKIVSPRGKPCRRQTGIRRDYVERALRRIASGNPRGTHWETLVKPVVIATAYDARASA